MAVIKDPKTATHRLMGVVREHPLPTLAVGLGLGWLAAEGVRGGPLLPLPAKWRRARRQAGAAAAVRRRLGVLGAAIEERPLAVGVAALAIGMLAGVALPATRREDRLLGEARDDLLDSARDAGRDALEMGREVARSAVERVKESVREQELTPEQLVEKARLVTLDAAETLRDAEREVVHGLGGGGGGGAAAEPLESPLPGTPPRL
jgi:hypothetical protein